MATVLLATDADWLYDEVDAALADDVGRRDDLESERAALIHRIQTDPNYPQMSVSMEMRHRHIEDAARSLVE